MKIEFDPDKDEKNRKKHSIALQRAEDMDIHQALTREDTRFNYGERRWVSIGPIDGQLYVLVWTLQGTRTRPVVRAISLRPAEPKEQA
ncbi:MAG TPA: BrnT family toxin, partial [Phenylobacterium sp.]|uniref:BrnT family toxin n=1 Tax=Phenylobacterium sp. TaxID=1871053 RepID=UPI002B49B949